jgi:hypothetical protein
MHFGTTRSSPQPACATSTHRRRDRGVDPGKEAPELARRAFRDQFDPIAVLYDLRPRPRGRKRRADALHEQLWPLNQAVNSAGLH